MALDSIDASQCAFRFACTAFRGKVVKEIARFWLEGLQKAKKTLQYKKPAVKCMLFTDMLYRVMALAACAIPTGTKTKEGRLD